MNDDFVIKIGDEIAEGIEIKNPPLEEGKYKIWGEPEAAPVRIIVGQRVYQQVMHHTQQHPTHEVGGVLLGRAYNHEGNTYVEAIESLAAPETHAGPAHLTFTPDSWSAINQQLEKEHPDLKIVGWYHSHPRMDIFFSGQDRFLHKNFFPEPWHIALVVEPHKHYGGFFTWQDDEIRPAKGFYELFDVSNESIINWRNLPLTSNQLEVVPHKKHSTDLVPFVLALAVAIFLAFMGVTLISINRLQKETYNIKQEISTLQSQQARLERAMWILVASATPHSTPSATPFFRQRPPLSSDQPSTSVAATTTATSLQTQKPTSTSTFTPTFTPTPIPTQTDTPTPVPSALPNIDEPSSPSIIVDQPINLVEPQKIPFDGKNLTLPAGTTRLILDVSIRNIAPEPIRVKSLQFVTISPSNNKEVSTSVQNEMPFTLQSDARKIIRIQLDLSSSGKYTLQLEGLINNNEAGLSTILGVDKQPIVLAITVQ